MREQTQADLNRVVAELSRISGQIRQDTTDVVATDDHIEIIRHFNSTRKAIETIKEARTVIEELAERLSREWVPETMRSHGVKSITVENVGRVTISNRYSASIIDKPLAFDWLRGNEAGGIIAETVNAQTLSAFAKEFFETKGKELPDDRFKVSTMTFTSIAKK